MQFDMYIKSTFCTALHEHKIRFKPLNIKLHFLRVNILLLCTDQSLTIYFINLSNLRFQSINFGDAKLKTYDSCLLVRLLSSSRTFQIINPCFFLSCYNNPSQCIMEANAIIIEHITLPSWHFNLLAAAFKKWDRLCTYKYF